jgi:hypothetical protein
MLENGSVKLWWELVGIDLEEILFPTRDIETLY